LERTLTSLYQACRNLNCELFVVDNASFDGSIEKVESGTLPAGRQEWKVESLKIIKNNQNLGFAKANNIAIRQAKGKYILLVNPDTEIEKNALVKMIEFMKNHPEAGAATCKVVLESGAIDWASHRGFPTPINAMFYFSRISKLLPFPPFSGYNLNHKPLDRVHEIDSPSGCFYLVRKDVVDKVGLLDEDYFMYAEDLDWSYRIKKAGFRIYYNPDVKIIHHKGISSGIKTHSEKTSQAFKETRLKAAASFYDTMKIFYDKHYKSKYPDFIRSLVFLSLDLLKHRRLAKLRSRK